MTHLTLAAMVLAAEPEGRLRGWWRALILFLVLSFLILFFSRKMDKDDQPVQMARRSAEAHVEEAVVDPAVVKSAGFDDEPESLFSTPAPASQDDLKIIEGIGPKIDGLLKAAGISTFEQLADADVSRLRQILDDAHLRIADPTTWPEQALLAAQGNLDELKDLQDRLNAGRKA